MSCSVTPAGVYYLLANPRLAEAHDYSTVEPLTGAACSAPNPLASSNILHTQQLSDNRHKDVKNEAHIKTRTTQHVVTEGHLLYDLPKGKYEVKNERQQGSYKGGGAGRYGKNKTESTGLRV